MSVVQGNTSDLEVGQVVDVYYIVPTSSDGQSHVIKDITEVASTGNNPEPWIAVRASEAVWALIFALLVPIAFFVLTHPDRTVRIAKRVVTVLSPTHRNPSFFERFLKDKGELEKVKRFLTNYPEIGRNPPTAEIYAKATTTLWILRATYSEDLRAGQPTLITKLMKDKNDLTVNLSIIDPTIAMKELARSEVGSLYLPHEEGWIVRGMIQNAYKRTSYEKFLYPWELDYCRKLNDSYAALSRLTIEARENGLLDRLRLFTTNDVGLRASFVKGDDTTVDLLYFNKGWTGMSGNIFRCTDTDGKGTFTREVIDLAEKERSKYVSAEPHLLSKVRDALSKSLSPYGLMTRSIRKYLSNPQDLGGLNDGWDELDQKLKDKSSNFKERITFLRDIGKDTGKDASVLIIPLA